ncbi:hypothetical protein GALMADRAFT_239245 [Galerina marginata CBS 339.88]|uniref:Uncharacterized protein n=1 Tax=Galerina marginata (strain CBS 339.88) TaxID=685588 RepID=A0A067TG96_GALM3|nr:hypothetical protein GALMADRAFT_239245 [Galerina marginata CBS 339.88]
MSTNFSPTPAELTVVSQIFAQADPQKLGVLTGDVAVRVFGGAKLLPTVLGEIWNLADEDNKGWLPKKGVAIAVRLIGWAQKGEKITQALANKPGPLAVIEGITAVSQQTTGMSLPKSPPPAFPPLSPHDKTKFQNMFMKYGPQNGLLSGDKARDIFVKSKLSNEQLLKIWNLADTQDRGVLDSTDFAIGMYFIQGVMTGKISFIPTALPPGLLQQAGGPGNSPSVRSHVTGTSGSFSPVSSTFGAQHTGQSQMLQPDYTGLSSSFISPNLPARPNPVSHGNGRALDWDVTPAEKSSADNFFETLDVQRRGYIEGDVAVPFMLKSQLPGEVLAQVWDLADIHNDGRLTRDGFAIAMHLIQKKLTGKEIPPTLPPSLVPPSLRDGRGSAPAVSPFSPLHAQPQQPEPAVDLFSFDDTPPPSAITPQPTNVMPALKNQSTGTPSGFPPIPNQRIREADPFTASPFHTPPRQDLLSDDDMHVAASPPLQDQSAEIGNLKNQLQSTNKSLSNVKEERETLERTLAEQASLLSTIQTQLSSAKAAYETETNLLASFKERRATQVADIQKTKEELIRAESDLSAVRVEKAEIEGAFLRDKEEARDLHKRMVEAGRQAEALKADVDKLKKEAKQQKGLLAIARKQLSTKESEKAKAEKEHEEALAEVTTIGQEKEGVEAEIATFDSLSETHLAHPKSPSDSLVFAAAQPLPVTPELPELSTPSKSNNPFERLAMSSGNSTPRSQSPFLPLSGTILSLAPNSTNATMTTSPPPLALSAENGISSPPQDDTELFYLGNEPSPIKGLENVVSPGTANGTEYFMTPPTSAINDSDLPMNPKDRFPSLDELPSPDLLAKKDASPASPVANPPLDHPETDLGARLKEMELEDSSDSDEDSDDMNVTAPSAANGKPFVEPHVVPPVVDQVSTSTISFDDVFGADDPKESSLTNGNATPIGVPSVVTDHPTNSFTPKPVDETRVVAGVNEFDETLAKLPSSAAATPATFSFDTAFDDNFDFASASKAAELAPVEQKEIAPKSDFDDVFGATSPAAAGPSTQPIPVSGQPTATTTVTTPSNPPKFETSFEAAFAGFDSVTGPKFGDTTFSASPSTTVPTENMSLPGSFPISPVPASPKAVAPAPRAVEIRTSPPPRERSPPPRMASPKPRLSSSSSKETNEKLKEPTTRHSKLSIRLPFGKKKKQQEPMLPPPSLLTPPVEHPHRIATPANEDDVEPVKQLTAMGFTRSQAIDALEKYGYDVQKALNSLLPQ